MTNSTIQPTEVERDQYGYWTHPNYFQPANVNEYGLQGEFDSWLDTNNLGFVVAWLESDGNAMNDAEQMAIAKNCFGAAVNAA